MTMLSQSQARFEKLSFVELVEPKLRTCRAHFCSERVAEDEQLCPACEVAEHEWWANASEEELMSISPMEPSHDPVLLPWNRLFLSPALSESFAFIP